MTDRELDLNGYSTEDLHYEIVSAIDLASDQNQATWLTEDGKRIAAIVPVDMAEYADVTRHLWWTQRGRPVTEARAGSLLGRLDRKLVKAPFPCPEPGREQS